MKKILSLCSVLLAAGGLVAQEAQPLTVQGHPHPYGLPAGTTANTAKNASALAAPAVGFTMDDIEFWVGEGSKRAAFVVQWNDPRETNALVWGYRFDGNDTYGADLVTDIAAADPAFYAMVQQTSLGYTICGLGYDADGDGEIALKHKTTGEIIYPDENRLFVNTGGYDYDNYTALDEDDYWGAGWYDSYWSYWISDGGSSFSYSGLGASSRRISDGSWDGWNFSLGMQSYSFKEFAAAPAPGYTNGAFFFRSDGTNTRADFLKNNGDWELDVYAAANSGESLPASLQKACMFSGKVLLLFPESSKAIVADAAKFIKQGELLFPGSPRCFAGTDSGKGYIGTDRGLFSVDLDNLSTGTCLESTEASGYTDLLYAQNRLFALQDDGKVIAVDPASGQISTLPADSCTALVQTASGAVWTAAGSTLYRIDPATLETTRTDLPEHARIGRFLLGSTEEEALFFTSGSATDSCSLYRFSPEDARSLDYPFFSLDESRYAHPRFASPAPVLDAQEGRLYVYARTESGEELAYCIEASTGNILSEEQTDGTLCTTGMAFPDASPAFSGLPGSLSFQINDPAQTISLAGTYSDPDDVDANMRLSATSSDPEILNVALGEDESLSVAPVEGQSGSAEVLLSLYSRGATTEKKISVDIHRPLEGIDIIPDTLYMKTGQKDTLQVRFFPETATNQNITWKYESYSTANITNAGIITARKAGETYVTATADDGGFTDTCRVFISDQPVTGLHFLQDTIEVYVNRYDTLEYEVLPLDASTQTMTWEVEDESIVSFATYNQRITGLQEGTTRISGTTRDGGFSDTCVVNVKFNPARAISLSEQEVWLTAPSSQTVDIRLEPANASNQSFTAYPLTDGIVDAQTYINTTGLTVRIKGIAAGETQILVQSDDDPRLIALCTAHISYIPVSGFALNRSDTVLAVGRSFTLSKQLLPESGVSNDTVTYISSDEAVATVSSYGSVRAVSPGEAFIVATTRDGGYTDTCHVSVVESIPMERIDFPQDEYVFDYGVTRSQSIAVVRTPSNATNTSVSYATSNPDVATISTAGYLTLRGAGETWISATAADGGHSDTCHVVVRPAVEEVRLSADTLRMVPQDSALLTATALPAESNPACTWSSTDESIVRIDTAGMAHALKAGEAFLVGEAVNGTTDTCKVIVENRQADGVTLDAHEADLLEGEAIQLSALVLPENTTDPRVRWSSTDHSVASVSAQGYVKAYGEGTAVIRVCTADGSERTDSCVVTVSRQPGTGIGQTPAGATACRAYLQGSNLIVEGCVGSTLYLTTSSGQLLRILQPEDDKVYYPTHLAPGVYLLTGTGEQGKIVLKFSAN